MIKIKRMLESILAVILYMIGGTCFGLWAILLILLSLVTTGAVFEKMLKWMCRSVLFFSGILVTVRGKENIDGSKQYIIMMNHVNIFDAFVAYSSFPGKGRAVEEESHFRWFLYGWLVKRIGMIPIDRKSGIKAMVSLKRAAELIRERKNFSVAVMPEGTRTRTGKLGPFKKGGFLLALETGLDILPMIQMGSLRINRKSDWIIRPGKVEVVIEKSISTAGYTKETVEELMEKTRKVYLGYVE